MPMFKWSHTLFCNTTKPETTEPDTSNPETTEPETSGPVRERIALAEQRIKDEIKGLLDDLKPSDIQVSLRLLKHDDKNLFFRLSPSVNITLTF